MEIHAPCGRMEGLDRGGFVQCLGIPYAKPPVGPLRFRPPEPAAPWEGVRDCRRPGHAAPQTAVPGLSHLTKNETMDEDCLYLNVTAPKGARRAPVLFWIHGGAFQKGSGLLGIRPETFAREGVVVVSANYRLGALGFLDVSGRLGEAYRQSGNSGLLDLTAALRWTRDNIGAFGGDPENVTIMGQSAGAKLCGALLLAPAAKGLFCRAVLSSGGVQCIRDQHTARRAAEAFFAEAGLAAGREEELLAMPWQTILRAQAPLFAGLNLHAVGPVFDGVTFDGGDAIAMLRRGAARDTAVLLGTNRDEMELYWQVYGVHGLDCALVERLFGNRAPLVMEAYGKIPHDAEFHRHFIRFFTEYVYRAPAVRMAEAAAEGGQTAYLYRLDWDRQAFRACHASETQFLMGMGLVIRDVDRSPAHERLARQMRGAFLSFLRTGRPEMEDLPPWPRFSLPDRAMMVFDAPCHVERAPEAGTDPRMPFQIFALD